MFKRRKFTLIELIVVIAVLGILAAIVIPNIGNFQNKARDAQLTADTRNVQTALDMYRLDQPDGVSEPILVTGSEEDTLIEVTLTATHELDKDGNLQEISEKVVDEDGNISSVAKPKYYRVLDLDKLYPNYLRQIPEYAVTPDDLDFKNGGKVVFATLLEYKLDENGEVIVDGSGKPVEGEKSTATVNALSYVNGELTIVR